MKAAIVGVHLSGSVLRAFLQLECGSHCQIPVRKGAARMGESKVWGWDGKVENPTVTPSIDCTKCGFHKTLQSGAWR